MCNHDIKDLVGTEGGIKCRACGKTFKNFAEIEADKKPAQDEKEGHSEPVPETFTDEPRETPIQKEKSVNEASDAKSAKKPAAKKTPSKKGAK